MKNISIRFRLFYSNIPEILWTKGFGTNPFKVARKFLFRLPSNVYTWCAINNVRNVTIQAISSQATQKYCFEMSTASNTSKELQLARKVIGFHWPMRSANGIVSSYLKTISSVLGNEKSIKSILISCAEIPSITNTYSNGVIELIFGILDSTKSKTDSTDALCTTCIRKIPQTSWVIRYCQERISLRRILTFQ